MRVQIRIKWQKSNEARNHYWKKVPNIVGTQSTSIQADVNKATKKDKNTEKFTDDNDAPYWEISAQLFCKFEFEKYFEANNFRQTYVYGYRPLLFITYFSFFVRLPCQSGHRQRKLVGAVTNYATDTSSSACSALLLIASSGNTQQHELLLSSLQCPLISTHSATLRSFS